MNGSFDAGLAALRAGRVVAAATESFFGFLADVTRSEALDRLAELKPRGADKGPPVLLHHRGGWDALVAEIPPAALELADAFWPGPLTIAAAAGPGLDPRLTLDGTVAVRLPGSSPSAELAAALGRPVTATSANLPGAEPPVTSSDVRDPFWRAIVENRLVVVDGVAPGGRPSTVVVVRGAVVRVAREGAISRDDIARATRSVVC